MTLWGRVERVIVWIAGRRVMGGCRCAGRINSDAGKIKPVRAGNCRSD
jgi:hypothetical protein